ncbi:cytochrome P450 [Nonomuraea basaltis]|uniref:cytochrome P450 n=1 Tax=Nonomuraea basaltis TaxID=2495887 RepID=UPI00110C5738|nr:cytochrome P450 [Nonomuraea basaltis]TMS00482.1 cytochrome P450 [Nonomuraea basaltis]
MLIAGHETTATGLAWAFERLLRLPEALERLPDHEPYLDAVVKEVLRVRPVVYEAARLLDAPLRLGEYEIPAGWYAGPYIPLVHRDPDVFDAPEEFRPERFLDGRQSRAWMPFGGGRRFCVGAQLALLEMRVIIREVLHRLELAAPDQAPEARRLKNVTLAPAKLTRVIARARTPARTA